MSVEVAALRVGGSVAQLAVGRWLAGRSARDGAGKDLVELIKTGFPDEIKRRRVQRQFEGIADSVAERLMTFAGHEFGGLTDGDRVAALDEVVRTLDRADLSDDALFAADADPVKLARGLRSRLPARKAEFELGEAGARLYEVVLDECCDCLARIIVHLPQFGPRASVEMLSRLSGLADQVDAVLARLPARTLDAPEGESDDDEFTRRYLASISNSLDTLELFGVRFERFTRPQTTLSVAYISLNVSDESRREPRRQAPRAVPISDWRDEVRKGAVRVEAALGGHRLMLLRGEAGGGKSTLLRWLAVTAARGSFSGPLRDWNGCVPFVVKLRSHAGKPLPRPEEFIDDVAGHLAGIMPRGWAHRRLGSGRALLLVDGVDEVPGAQRQAVRTWLKGIVGAFRGIRIIVTSRPAAAGSDWLRAEGFATAFLEQLAPADIRTLVRHWHNAVRDCPDLPCPPQRLPSYEARLLARLESAPHLRTLASSPLLAAMLCALNLDREVLPRNRMGLYGAALDMLLETRDARRGIPSALERDQKVRILQDIAWHLSTSSRVELPKRMVERLVADRLASMPQVRVPPDEVLGELLQRSGVLREPVPGRIDFVHRTVQEYLAAKQAADLGDMELLVQHAHRDTWRETVIMAAGHANEPLRRELLSGILARARAERRQGRALKLMAIACLETLPSVPDDLRSDLDECLDDLIPPRDEASARSLATAGEPVLARLPETLDGLSEAAASATVQTAWLINGPGALDLLARYARDTRRRVRDELNQAWSYFDADEYAEHVLGRSPAGGTLRIHRQPRQMEALGKVPPLSDLSVDAEDIDDFDFLSPHAGELVHLSLEAENLVPDLAGLPPLPALRSLEIVLPSHLLGDLAFLDALPRLDELWLSDCERISEFSPVKRQTELTHLSLFGCTRLASLDELPLGRLRSLDISDTDLAGGFADIGAKIPGLRQLYVGRCDGLTDLRPLADLPLTDLWIPGCKQVTDFGSLSLLTGVRRLHVGWSEIEDLRPLQSLPRLTLLDLENCRRLSDLGPLASLPSLRELILADAAPGLDLSPLAANRRLTVTIRAGQDVRGAEALGRRLKIR